MRHLEETKNKMSKSHTVNNSLKAVKMKELSEDDFESYWSCYRKKLSGSNNHFFGKTHSKTTREHLSNIKSKLIANGEINFGPSRYGLKGYYKSLKSNEVFRFDSFAEYLRMIILDKHDDVLYWTKRHRIRIKYVLDSSNKIYIPDFLIKLKNGNEILEEVKGYENERKKNLKFEALHMYCINNKLISNIVTYQDIKDMCFFYFGKSIDNLRREYKRDYINV